MFMLKPGHDNRLPVSGKETMKWEGIHTFDYNPKVYNPQQGYIVNWNYRPARGVLNYDFFNGERPQDVENNRVSEIKMNY